MFSSFFVGRSLFLDKEGDASGTSDIKEKNKRSSGYNPDMSDEELKVKVDSLVEKQAAGDLKTALGILQRDSAKVREVNRKAREQIEKMTELPEADKLLLDAAKKAKFTPETISLTLAKLKELETKTAEMAFEAEVEIGAKAIGVNKAVLKDQLKLNNQHLENREIHVEVTKGKETVVELRKVPHVRPIADEKSPLTPASTWIKTLSKEYQQALAVKPDTTQKDKTTSFTAFPEQPAGDKVPDQKRAVDIHMESLYGVIPDMPGVINPTKPATQGA